MVSWSSCHSLRCILLDCTHFLLHCIVLERTSRKRRSERSFITRSIVRSSMKCGPSVAEHMRCSLGGRRAHTRRFGADTRGDLSPERVLKRTAHRTVRTASCAPHRAHCTVRTAHDRGCSALVQCTPFGKVGRDAVAPGVCMQQRSPPPQRPHPYGVDGGSCPHPLPRRPVCLRYKWGHGSHDQ